MTRRAASALIVFALLLGGCGGESDGAARATATPAAEGRQLPEYGLGLGRRIEDGEEVWGHSGGAVGVQSELWHVPRLGLTLATVANDELSAQPHQQQALLRVALESLDSGAGPP